MKKNILLCLLTLSSFCTFAQSHFTVSGKVIDKNTGAPMQGASVFAQNTTFGVATDNEGSFRLKLPSGGYDLVATFTGYETESIRITNASESDNLLLPLKLREKTMEEVSVVVTSEVKDGWTKYGQFFFEHFIGRSSNSKQCLIKNPEVLKFYFSKKRNRLKVLAAEPLLISNDALGYNIKYALDSFTYEYNTNVAFYIGYPLFENMEGSEEKQAKWKENRDNAYYGSMLHFMRSLYNMELEEEGFEAQFLVTVNDKQKLIPLKNIYPALNYVRNDSLKSVEFRPNQPDLAIIYTGENPEQAYIDLFDKNANKEYQVSILSFVPKATIVIEENGYFYEQTELTSNGYWGFEKLADMVPYDY